MRRVAIAMTTTGPEPKQGHRITELAAVEMNNGVTGKTLHLRITPHAALGPGQAGVAFSEALACWTQFIAGSPMIVHDYYEFKRFLRADCARESVGFDIARDYPVIDTWQLARTRFPRQRHGLGAVMRKLGIESNLAALDALDTARMIARVANKLSTADDADPARQLSPVNISPDMASRSATQSIMTTFDVQIAAVPQWRHRFTARIGTFWRQLLGRKA